MKRLELPLAEKYRSLRVYQKNTNKYNILELSNYSHHDKLRTNDKTRHRNDWIQDNSPDENRTLAYLVRVSNNSSDFLQNKVKSGRVLWA